MKWVLKWTLIIFAAIFLFHLILQGGSSSDDLKTEEPVETPRDVNVALSECLLPKAQYGQYSSYDGGKSAVSLLTRECPTEAAAWIADCQKKTGADEQTCGANALVAAQAAIKSFNK
jgi:hypothetical protein